MKIKVTANPAARENKVEEVGENEFIVSVTELPVQGRANSAIVELLAEHFGVSKSEVRLVSGFKTRQKTFEINPQNPQK